MLASIALAAVILIIATVVLVIYEMYTNKEAFENVPHDIFRAKNVPYGEDELSKLNPGPAFQGEKLLISSPASVMPEIESLRNWGAMTSEQCYRSDQGEALKKTRNFLQRTNNYSRSHPDSCSAPNHEFIGTFYNPMTGVGSTPSPGTNQPPSTKPCAS
jgi:hypothetical protein